MGKVPVCQYAVTIPRMLRHCFNCNRKLLGELRQCFWDSIKEILLAALNLVVPRQARRPFRPRSPRCKPTNRPRPGSTLMFTV